MLALLAAIDLQGGAPCWTLPSPTLLVLLRRYECPVTCAQMYCGQELLSAAGVDWKGCCCSWTMRLLLPLPLADSGMSTFLEWICISES
ncbi:uncharacterized protein [Aegilops tauschii subsp. strangulata]|uniref:uncharacterized protein isoform X2 n=1 Tax=Aegilops tauschii subsp. strangulata TaxID=200361 RepID=UPI00098A09E2|nr:uncharacterized protein LOC109765267 isoform X2 [Aegilops tauschii subsp. strangulata]XP_020184852.1 uncharacterized protein LOC109770555 isoform X3 [Aegilops tauschii subsp. strangulata]XP_044439697.1 uncharacterized protein LOC123165999 isoform X3 [Triticum aestivum]